MIRRARDHRLPAPARPAGADTAIAHPAHSLLNRRVEPLHHYSSKRPRDLVRTSLNKPRDRRSCSAFTDVQSRRAPANTRPTQRSGMNSFNRIRDHLAPNRGYNSLRRIRKDSSFSRWRQTPRQKRSAISLARGVAGWRIKSAVTLTGSSQPKYSWSTNVSTPSALRIALWNPKSEGTSERDAGTNAVVKSSPASA